MTLLISKVNQLGDNIVFLPVVQALRHVLPDARIVIVTSPVACELYPASSTNTIVLAEPTAAFNDAWRRPWTLPRLIADWRAHRPDAVLLGDDQGHVAHVLAWTSGAAVRVGPMTEHIRLGSLLTERVALDVRSSVALQNWGLMLALLRRLGIDHDLPSSPPAPDLSHLLAEAPLTPIRPEIVIHPGASRDYKRWPLERYIALANALSEDHVVNWIETSIGPSATELHQRITRLKPSSLANFATVLASSKLFIGNNSGPMNLASALGVPSIIFNGPSQPSWDPPWHPERFTLLRDPSLPCQPCDSLTQPSNVCTNLKEPMACMKRWSVESIVELAKTRLRTTH